MYAVIETGGKQYRVEVGTELEVELLDVEPGKTITLERVLLVADGDEATIGRPLVAEASVSAEVVNQTRGPKLISFKYRPKARSRVKKGHRQELTVLRIADITLNGKSAATDARQSADAARTERERVADTAAAQAAKDAELAAKLSVGAATPAKKPAGAKATSAKGATKATAPTKATAAGTADAKAPAKPKAKADAAAAPAKTTARSKAVPAESTETPPAQPKRTRATKKDE